MRMLVIGGTGIAGTAVVDKGVEKGVHITVISRGFSKLINRNYDI